MLLIAVTIAGLAAAVGYYVSTGAKNSSGLADQARTQALNAGEILREIYYARNGSDSYFYVENIGNVPVTVSGCFTNSGPITCNLYTPSPNSSAVSPATILPGRIYFISVDVAVASIVVQTSTGNLLEIGGGSVGTASAASNSTTSSSASTSPTTSQSSSSTITTTTSAVSSGATSTTTVCIGNICA